MARPSRSTDALRVVVLALGVTGCGAGNASNPEGARDGGDGQATSSDDDARPDDLTPGTEDDDAPPGPEPRETPDDDVAAPSDPDTMEPVAASEALHIPAVRLTRTQLDVALATLLGETTAPAARFLAEDEYSPYDNDFARQTVSPALIDSLEYLAEDVAARVLDDAEARARLVPCTPSAPDDAACFDQVVRGLAPLFFRAPPSDEDVASYQVLLDFAREQQDFDVAVELLIESFIQDPEFLYRLERGTTGDGLLNLDGYEIANRMSFLLWGTGPDAAILAQAADGSLVDAATRRAVAETLLDDDRARTELHRFHAMWLGYRSLPHDAALNQAFTRETEALIDRVFTGGARYLDLFDSSETFIDETLAAHYGFDAPPQGEGWVPYPADSGRAGILAHGSVLSSFSKFFDTSPTQRGIFVRTRLLCQSVPAPPAVVDVDQPPEEGSTSCKIDRYRAHSEQSGCRECHESFDPIGFGLENYDMAGRFREHDDGNEDCVIDGTGALPGVGDFSGPAELSRLLVENDLIDVCFTRQYLSHALATSELESGDAALAVELADAFETGAHDLRAWLLDLIASERFVHRPEEAP